MGDDRGGARNAAEEADKEESSDAVGARRVIFLEVRVASSMSAEKGGFSIPTLGLIMYFWLAMGILSCSKTSWDRSWIVASLRNDNV